MPVYLRQLELCPFTPIGGVRNSNDAKESPKQKSHEMGFHLPPSQQFIRFKRKYTTSVTNCKGSGYAVTETVWSFKVFRVVLNVRIQRWDKKPAVIERIVSLWHLHFLKLLDTTTPNLTSESCWDGGVRVSDHPTNSSDRGTFSLLL